MNQIEQYQPLFWQTVFSVIVGIAFIVIIASEAIKAIKEAL